MMICRHVGLEYSDDVDIIDADIPVIGPQDYFINPDTAVINRQEYQMLEMAVEAEKLQKRIARGENMPQLLVGAQGLYLDAMENESTTGLLFANITIPISGWWGGAHKIKEHQIKIEIAENKLAESTELLTFQIEKSYKDLAESRSQVVIAEKSVEQVNEHLKVTRDSYDAGLIGTSDMLEAQAMFQEAEDKLSDAQCIYKIKQAYYKKACVK
jgi:outer membrane protein